MAVTVATDVALLVTVIPIGVSGAWLTATVTETLPPMLTVAGFGVSVIAGATTANGKLDESMKLPTLSGSGFETATLKVHGVAGHAVLSMAVAMFGRLRAGVGLHYHACGHAGT